MSRFDPRDLRGELVLEVAVAARDGAPDSRLCELGLLLADVEARLADRDLSERERLTRRQMVVGNLGRPDVNRHGRRQARPTLTV